jgi:RimJ/RimL family protein N-acetyltransferase
MILENLTTERLKIRSLRPSDKPYLMEFFQHEEATKYLYIKEDLNKYCDDWIARQRMRYETLGYSLAAVELRETGEFIGQCGLISQEVDGVEELEVGYHLLPKYWGNGYATEATQGCMKFAFENNMVDSIISLIVVDNIPSQKVAERNGLKRTIRTDFKGFDIYVYRIMKAEWESKNL